MDTTRRYPRTLNEAFPRTADYANPIEHHRPYNGDRLVIWAGVLGFAAFGLMTLVGWIK